MILFNYICYRNMIKYKYCVLDNDKKNDIIKKLTVLAFLLYHLIISE